MYVSLRRITSATLKMGHNFTGSALMMQSRRCRNTERTSLADRLLINIVTVIIQLFYYNFYKINYLVERQSLVRLYIVLHLV